MAVLLDRREAQVLLGFGVNRSAKPMTMYIHGGEEEEEEGKTKLRLLRAVAE